MSIVGPAGWRNHRKSEWGDVPRWTGEIKGLIDSGGGTMVDIDNLRLYGSSRRRPLVRAGAFLSQKMGAEAMTERYGIALKEGNLNDIDQERILEIFLVTQIEENLRAIYAMVFGEAKTLRGWLNKSEKGQFLDLLKNLKSEEERKKFWDFQKGMHVRNFADLWRRRVQIIDDFINAFDAEEAPETYKPLGHHNVRQIAELIGLDIEAVLNDAKSFEAPQETETAEKMDRGKMDEVVSKTIEEFIDWLEQSGFESNIFDKVNEWNSKAERIVTLDQRSPFSASVTWVGTTIELKDLEHWNAQKRPAEALRWAVWHEMTHVLQIEGHGVKAWENSMFLLELQAILGEFILGENAPEMRVAIEQMMHRRAVYFEIGQEMHAKGVDVTTDWRERLLSKGVVTETSVDAALGSLLTGPVNLQQYWLAYCWLKKQVDEGKDLVTIYKGMFKKGGVIDLPS